MSSILETFMPRKVDLHQSQKIDHHRTVIRVITSEKRHNDTIVGKLKDMMPHMLVLVYKINRTNERIQPWCDSVEEKGTRSFTCCNIFSAEVQHILIIVYISHSPFRPMILSHLLRNDCMSSLGLRQRRLKILFQDSQDHNCRTMSRLSVHRLIYLLTSLL